MKRIFPIVATAAAQSTMDKKSDRMMGKSTSMKGCVETGSTAGTFMLTHVDMGKMPKGKTSKDTASTATMAKDTMGTMSNNVDLLWAQSWPPRQTHARGFRCCNSH